MLSRNILRTSAALLRNAPKNVKVAPVAVQSFSTILEKKELAEETKYIRQLEERRREEIRHNLERILALEDSSKEKQDLVGLLAKKDEEEKSWFAKVGLDKWQYALPTGLLLGIPLVYHEVIIIDAELQLTGSFLIFAAAMYQYAGPLIGKAFDDYSKETEKELESINAAVHTQIEDAQNANTQALTLEEDLKLLHALTDQVSAAHADILNQLEEQKYRDAVIKKLETLSALEESTSSSIRQRIVTSVKADALKAIKTNKAVQENALNQAIAILSAGSGAKLGKDVVGEVFTNAIKTYKDNYAKLPAGQDEVLKQLEKDAAALATAPEVTGKGGNVFVVSPVA